MAAAEEAAAAGTTRAGAETPTRATTRTRGAAAKPAAVAPHGRAAADVRLRVDGRLSPPGVRLLRAPDPPHRCVTAHTADYGFMSLIFLYRGNRGCQAASHRSCAADRVPAHSSFYSPPRPSHPPLCPSKHQSDLREKSNHRGRGDGAGRAGHGAGAAVLAKNAAGVGAQAPVPGGGGHGPKLPVLGARLCWGVLLGLVILLRA